MVIEWKGGAFRRLEQRPGRKLPVAVNAVNECDICEYRSVRRFLMVETAPITRAGWISIKLGEGVSTDEVPDNLLPCVLKGG